MSLLGRSFLVLGLLFGLLFAVAMAALAYNHLPLWWGAAISIGILLLQYLISPWIIQWIYKIRWAEMDDISPEVRQYLLQVCQKAKVPTPRLGIIEDGNPNAFTFGHYPGDARLVVTRGLLDILDEEEQKAVVGHEVGHIAHWDFVVMTLAAVVPLLLYLIYRATAGGERGKGSRDRGGYAAAVGIAAYIAYVASQYIVLLLSRVREFYADEFSAHSTRNPNALARALVKIAYGLARAPKGDEKKQDLGMAQAGKALGIFDPKVAGNLALAAAGSATADGVTPETVVNAMKWDLWNPWGTYYEIHSTHPLPAKRIRSLDRMAVRLGQAPAFDLPRTQPESYWDEFAVDLLTLALPILGLLLGLGVGAAAGFRAGNPLPAIGPALIGLGIGGLIRSARTHPQGSFPVRSVESLVGEVKVSDVRSVPCLVEGTIIGRGVPGLYCSEDLVLQDSTGFIVLDYRQPIKLLEWLFGVFRAESFIGQKARAIGWYRRSPRPYLELLRVEFEHMPAQNCHVYIGQLALWVLVTLAGVGAAVFTYMRPLGF